VREQRDRAAEQIGEHRVIARRTNSRRIKKLNGRLTGKIALVTGGRGGIGRAICARFLKEGAVVYAADLTNSGSMDADADAEDGAHFVRLDVTSEDEAKAALKKVEADRGRLDILVNAAGIEIECTVEETTLDDWNRIFAINVTGTFLLSKYALPLMRKAATSGTSASIINFGSYDGFIADPGLAAYCATKGAVHALTRAMACDHGPEGVRVNAICPGFIDTPMLRKFFTGAGSGAGGVSVDTALDALKDIHPTRTCGTPEDIANLVTWLASDEARYASGQLWVLDGGLTAQVQQMKL
jgi:NAD(P)-dependent dehydrogenase (short-subunit alcohol dehydrogenase family)